MLLHQGAQEVKMRQPIHAGGRSGSKAGWTDKRDWMAEFPAESSPESRLLAGATTLPVIARGADRSGIAASRGRKRTHRSMLLTIAAMALLAISAGAVSVVLWIPGATPLPVSQWPVAPPPLFSSPAAVPNPTLAAPALEPQPTPEPPAEPAPVPSTPVASTPVAIAPPAARTHSPAVAAVDSAAASTNEVSAILTVLDRYRLAFSSLNAGAVRAVWPGADIRALAGEFAGIKRQTLALDNCRIDVQGVQAEAVCAGRVSLVTKSGDQRPAIQSRRWTFTLVQQTDTWKIQTVDTQ
jgi:hypothetical protein